MNITESFYKKTILYKFLDQELKFKVSQDLFSSQNIDHGTQRLIRSLLYQKINSYKKALDLGCGYGPIGIVLKKICPSAEVHMVDYDALAIEYCKENVKLNHVDNVKVYPSLGYEQIATNEFNLITSNIPAKVGKATLKHMIKEAKRYLTENGTMAIVVIDDINDLVSQFLEKDDDIAILYHQNWPGHHVYHYKFINHKGLLKPKQLLFGRKLFFRGQNKLRFEDCEYELDVSYNLPEFDQLNYETSLLIDNIKKIKNNNTNEIICFNVKQGYIPLVACKAFQRNAVHLVDRDLLALLTARHNLKKYGIKAFIYHQVEFKIPKKQFNLIIGIVPRKQKILTYGLYLQQFTDLLSNNGLMCLSSSSTVISVLFGTIAKSKNIRIAFRKKAKGKSVILLEKVI